MVTVASGCIPTCPYLPKIESQTTGTAKDILSNEKGREGKIITVGGVIIGPETAGWPSVQEKEVVVLGMLADMGQDSIGCPGKSWGKD